MNDFEKIIANLRQLVDERHKAGHKAIDDLVASFSGPTLPHVTPTKTRKAVRPKPKTIATQSDHGTFADKVYGAIRTTAKSIEQIADELGSTRRKVRGVLYGPAAKGKVVKEKIGTRLFFVASEHATALKKADPHTGVQTNRELVEQAVKSRPGATIDELIADTGLEDRQIRSAIHAQGQRELFRIEKAGVTAHYYLADTKNGNR